MTRWLLIAAMLLVGCGSWFRSSVPGEARELTADERAIVVEHVQRWETVVGPLGERCHDYADRLRVIDADARELLRWCQRRVEGGCPAQRDDTGIVIVNRELGHAGYADVIGHEATHLLGHCSRPAGIDWLGHEDPRLWGAEGVHPL